MGDDISQRKQWLNSRSSKAALSIYGGDEFKREPRGKSRAFVDNSLMSEPRFTLESRSAQSCSSAPRRTDSIGESAVANFGRERFFVSARALAFLSAARELNCAVWRGSAALQQSRGVACTFK